MRYVILRELDRTRAIADDAGRAAELVTLAEVPIARMKIPILALVFGTKDRTRPTFGLFGGVHGLELVGSQVILSYLEGLVARLRWDRHLSVMFENFRLIAIPLVNPGGAMLNRRSNPRGVDLMRNAPVDAELDPPLLVGGHRLGGFLPWYRGPAGAPLEIESGALVRFVQDEMFPADAAIALDLHSGFGFVDRLWHPYAKTHSAFPRLGEARRIAGLLGATHPNHVYLVEPQSRSYTTHGDLWDYLVDLHVAAEPNRVFIPWTLEMGSWIWLRKNPRQAFSMSGPFNPMEPHRHRRIMRRHQNLIDFFTAVTRNHQSWTTALDAGPLGAR